MPKVISAQKKKDIREAIEAGIKLADIRELLSTSAGTISNIKREMGLPVRPMKKASKRGPVRTVAQPSWDGRNYDVAEGYIESLGSERPVGILPPEDYVAAFEARVLEYHTLIRAKDSEIERLRKENSTLRAEYQQVVFRQQNWTGPTSTMSQSLGNGG